MDGEYTRREFAAVLRGDLPSFIQQVFKTLETARFRPNWHIEAIAHQLDLCRRGQTKRLLITQPPRSLKSICVSVAYVAWRLGHDPGRKFICVSYSNELAGSFARQFRTIVASQWYREVFPGVRLKRDTDFELITSRGGGRLATSVGGTLTGRGADEIIIDDPMKAEDGQSETARARVHEWFGGTLATRLNNKNEGIIIVVQQRLHEDDLAGHLIERGGWEHLDLPAIAIEPQHIQLGDGEVHTRSPGDVLHPAHEDKAALDRIKAEIGSFNFSAQYQQRPVPFEGNLVKMDWFRFYDRLPAHDSDGRIVQSWDTASKAGELNDYSVCTTWLVKGKDYYLLDVYRGRHDFPDLKKKAMQLFEHWGARLVLVEDAGSGTALIQELRRARRGIRVVGIKPEQDKITRFSTESVAIEAGHVHLPKEAPWLDTFLHELLAFPYGKFDDQVDSVSQFLRRYNPRYRRGLGSGRTT